uniref:Uncharacterized protein n=1 Tax=Aegilops tauschii TaxID=37682 RepID=R7WBE8_AEGTA
MTVTRLPRFPHRRPGIVQKQVNNICPGEWLWQANRTRYKVKEKKSEKFLSVRMTETWHVAKMDDHLVELCAILQRVGGLKGMSTDDEDSDSD